MRFRVSWRISNKIYKLVNLIELRGLVLLLAFEKSAFCGLLS